MIARLRLAPVRLAPMNALNPPLMLARLRLAPLRSEPRNALTPLIVAPVRLTSTSVLDRIAPDRCAAEVRAVQIRIEQGAERSDAPDRYAVTLSSP